MEESQFWLRIWGMGTLVFVCMIAAFTHGAHDRRDKWEKAVANGADPMVAACALFEQTEAERQTCALLAQNRK